MKPKRNDSVSILEADKRISLFCVGPNVIGLLPLGDACNALGTGQFVANCVQSMGDCPRFFTGIIFVIRSFIAFRPTSWALSCHY